MSRPGALPGKYVDVDVFAGAPDQREVDLYYTPHPVPTTKLLAEQRDALVALFGHVPEEDGKVAPWRVRTALRFARGRAKAAELTEQLPAETLRELQRRLFADGFLTAVLCVLKERPLQPAELGEVSASSTPWWNDGGAAARAIAPEIRRRLRPLIDRLLAKVQP